MPYPQETCFGRGAAALSARRFSAQIQLRLQMLKFPLISCESARYDPPNKIPAHVFLEAEMGLVIREYVKRDAGKCRKIQVSISFDSPGIFDTPYKSALHRQFILHELRYQTGPAPAFLGRHKKKNRRLGKYQRHVPLTWKEAILRDAPLLRGFFFAEEPKWRKKMLRWCDKNLEPDHSNSPATRA
jgi:hypothetical protein